MNQRQYLITTTSLSAGGVLFAGYLSGMRFFASSCAFDEPCPTFLGAPACYVGLALFVALLSLSLAGLAGLAGAAGLAPKVNAGLGAAGTLFALYVSATDLVLWRDVGAAGYRLGLPTCVYGAVFFVAILVLSLAMLVRERRHVEAHA